jgi:hypothetical protein
MRSRISIKSAFDFNIFPYVMKVLEKKNGRYSGRT